MTSLAAADIAPIPEGASRFDHVRKHLYCTKERWDLIVPTLPRAPKDVARQHGCPDSLRLGYHEACDSCRAHVLGDHDRFYEPAYREALVTAIAAKRCGALPEHSRRSVLYLGDNGVMVAVNKVAGKPRSDGDERGESLIELFLARAAEIHGDAGLSASLGTLPLRDWAEAAPADGPLAKLSSIIARMIDRWLPGHVPKQERAARSLNEPDAVSEPGPAAPDPEPSASATFEERLNLVWAHLCHRVFPASGDL